MFGSDRDGAARAAGSNPALHQVYLRYVGPRWGAWCTNCAN